MFGESVLSDDALQAIISLLETNNTLQQINMPWPMLSSDSIQKYLKAVEASQSLQKLNISMLNLTYDDCVAIGSCLKHKKSINELKLSRLQMTDKEEDFTINYSISLIKVLKHLCQIIDESVILPWDYEVLESELYLYLRRVAIHFLWDTPLYNVTSTSESTNNAANIEETQTIIIKYTSCLCEMFKQSLRALEKYLPRGMEHLVIGSDIYLDFQKNVICYLRDKFLHYVSTTSNRTTTVTAIENKLQSLYGIAQSKANSLASVQWYYFTHDLWETMRCTSWALTFSSRLERIADGIQVNTSLQCLEMSWFIIRDEEVAIISDCIIHHKSIKELRLTNAHINCEGATKLFKSIKVNDVIQKVDVSHNEISDDGALAIAECLTANTTLRCLNFSHNKIYDDGLSSISSSLEDNKTLEEICMSCDKISDEVASKLAAALKKSNLHTAIIDASSSDSYCFNKIILSAMHHNNTIIALTLPRVQKHEELSIQLLKNYVENINLNRRSQGNNELSVTFEEFRDYYGTMYEHCKL